MKRHNFSAGPAILPQEVLDGMAEAIKSYTKSGLSLLEVSHRSPEISAMVEETRLLVREILELSDEHEVLFLGGGATTQFAMMPMNILPADGSAGYCDTGTWTNKAIKEARNFGLIDVAGSSQDDGYKFIPKDFRFDPDWFYFWYCSNNTVYGTQSHSIPETEVPLVVDMSSDIFSRKIDANKFDAIIAGAQKNMGPAGVTLVIIKKSLLNETERAIPDIFNYEKHIAKKSMLNTPPVLSIYGCNLTLKWIKKIGLGEIDQRNKEKAQILYTEIDHNPMFKGRVAKEDRSTMNVTFDITNEDLFESFITFADNYGIEGIRGHRSVGGYRASLYNAMEKDSPLMLVKAMQDFAWRFNK
ncbi:3-phosphoserine/phosphohydroxythreonine transaminase [Chitinophagales bacterium]|nr:3-phosphoserine/phosphohydroxythreonine transaminase [Chitinophagales bacterium]